MASIKMTVSELLSRIKNVCPHIERYGYIVQALNDRQWQKAHDLLERKIHVMEAEIEDLKAVKAIVGRAHQ